MKRFSIITMLVLAITLTATAQQRKRTAPVRKAATAQSTATKSKANICIVNMKDISLEKPLAEDANYLYLIDQLDRSIIGIDKKNGRHQEADSRWPRQHDYRHWPRRQGPLYDGDQSRTGALRRQEPRNIALSLCHQ